MADVAATLAALSGVLWLLLTAGASIADVAGEVLFLGGVVSLPLFLLPLCGLDDA